MKLFALHMGKLYRVYATAHTVSAANTAIDDMEGLSVLGITKREIILVHEDDLGIPVAPETLRQL